VSRGKKFSKISKAISTTTTINRQTNNILPSVSSRLGICLQGWQICVNFAHNKNGNTFLMEILALFFIHSQLHYFDRSCGYKNAGIFFEENFAFLSLLPPIFAHRKIFCSLLTVHKVYNKYNTKWPFVIER
jgi:hypothetical protein